jgi:hypothetical protein
MKAGSSQGDSDQQRGADSDRVLYQCGGAIRPERFRESRGGRVLRESR